MLMKKKWLIVLSIIAMVMATMTATAKDEPINCDLQIHYFGSSLNLNPAEDFVILCEEQK